MLGSFGKSHTADTAQLVKEGALAMTLKEEEEANEEDDVQSVHSQYSNVSFSDYCLLLLGEEEPEPRPSQFKKRRGRDDRRSSLNPPPMRKFLSVQEAKEKALEDLKKKRDQIRTVANEKAKKKKEQQQKQQLSKTSDDNPFEQKSAPKKRELKSTSSVDEVQDQKR